MSWVFEILLCGTQEHHLSHMLNIMTADGLVTQGARASAAIVLD